MMPGNPAFGATVLRIPAEQSPNFITGVSGWIIRQDGSAEFNNLTIRGTFNGTDFIINSTGEFSYSGTPAAGNLIGSRVTADGTDPFNNATLAGETTYGPGPGGTRIALQMAAFVPALGVGFAWYSAATAAGPWTQQIALAAPTSLHNLSLVMPSGLTGTLPAVQSDTSTNTNANNGTQPLTVSYTIPANDAQAGTVYEIEVPFNGIFENQTFGVKPHLNAATLATSGGDTIGAGFFTAGQAFAGLVKLKVVITATGAGGTANFFIDGGIGFNGNRSAGANNNNAYLSSQNTGQAFNTTVANTVSIDSVWGGSTAGQTVSGTGSTLTRKGP